MSMRKLKKEKWLLVFIGGMEEDLKAVDMYINGLNKNKSITPPKYVKETITREKALMLTEKPSAENEIAEELNAFVFSDIMEWKTVHRAQQVAVMFSYTAFKSYEVFLKVVRNKIFEDGCYHAICRTSAFTDTKNRKKCVKNKICGKCSELDEKCEHSCFARLIWMMYECKNDEVLNDFDAMFGDSVIETPNIRRESKEHSM